MKEDETDIDIVRLGETVMGNKVNNLVVVTEDDGSRWITYEDYDALFHQATQSNSMWRKIAEACITQVEVIHAMLAKEHRDFVYALTNLELEGVDKERAMWKEHAYANPDCPVCVLLNKTGKE